MPATPETPETPDAPAPTIILTEVPLKAVDVTRITALHEGDEPAYRVLVPADTKRNVLVSVLNHLSLFEMRKALEAIKPVNRNAAQTDAQTTLAESLKVLEEAGVQATGLVTEDDPLPQLEAEVARIQAGEVIIVTQPHAVQDTFHTDWASEARERLGVPVLHVYTGDWRLG